jgi:putative sterol carrier protein
MEGFMAAIFISQDWMDTLCKRLNSDARYAQIASKWEGDLSIAIEPGGDLTEPLFIYLDLWHGTCRAAKIIPASESLSPAFTLTATYEDITKILTGKLDPMQAMMIRKLRVQGSMAYMMRNVPTVLDFVRVAREVTTEILS